MLPQFLANFLPSALAPLELVTRFAFFGKFSAERDTIANEPVVRRGRIALSKASMPKSARFRKSTGSLAGYVIRFWPNLKCQGGMPVGDSVYVLGGFQTDFARHLGREGGDSLSLMREVIDGTLSDARIDPSDVDVAHVGNFTGELFSHQGQLGGLVAQCRPELEGVPASRHEAACASGGVAVLAAMADIEAGRYEVALVVGLELMRHVPAEVGADYLAAAAHYGHEAVDATYLWPSMFADLADTYEARYGLDGRHLEQLSLMAYRNAKHNPNAQTRGWDVDADRYRSQPQNPAVAGRLTKLDCGRITDGAAGLVLASAGAAERWAKRHRVTDALPKMLGWGHRTASLSFATKVARAQGDDYVFPQLRRAIVDARLRAGLDPSDPAGSLDAVEVHDCFSITGYMLVDHLGFAAPGHAAEVLDAGLIEPGGAVPLNPSGGLLGLGHPVGATGVRMVVDAARQVSGRAGACQVDGAKRVQTVNLGGSATTSVSFVVGSE